MATLLPPIERRGRIATLRGQPQAWSVFLQGRRRRRAAPDAPPPVVFTVPAPTAFWRMEEASGTRFDSVGGRHLTDVNTVGQAAGRIGNAASFDRNNWESLETPDNLALRPENGSFSISAWVYVDGALAENYSIVSKFHEEFGSGNPDREYALFINTVGHGFSPNHPVIRLALGVKSLISNVREGNVRGAIVDSVGILADGAAIALPGVPGGAGLAIKGARAVSRANDVVQRGNAVVEAGQAASEGDLLGAAQAAAGAVRGKGKGGGNNPSANVSGKGTTKASPRGSTKEPTEPHGNKVDERPATRYEKYDKDGNFEKHGVTKHEDPSKRYTKGEIDGGEVRPIERGPRSEMIKKERDSVETNPGPLNREPWAGKRKPQE